MDGIGFIAVIVLVFVGVPIIIGFLLYFIPKKLGYHRTAKWLLGIYSCAVALFLLYVLFEDQLFFKSDAKKLLKEQDIILNDDFRILSNSSMSGIGDYYHTFTLSISGKDKADIINAFKSDSLFKQQGEYPGNLLDPYFAQTIKDVRPSSRPYETSEAYIKEFLASNEDYKNLRRITINKSGNTLMFEDIDP